MSHTWFSNKNKTQDSNFQGGMKRERSFLVSCGRVSFLRRRGVVSCVTSSIIAIPKPRLKCSLCTQSKGLKAGQPSPGTYKEKRNIWQTGGNKTDQVVPGRNPYNLIPRGPRNSHPYEASVNLCWFVVMGSRIWTRQTLKQNVCPYWWRAKDSSQQSWCAPVAFWPLFPPISSEGPQPTGQIQLLPVFALLLS